MFRNNYYKNNKYKIILYNLLYNLLYNKNII